MAEQRRKKEKNFLVQGYPRDCGGDYKDYRGRVPDSSYQYSRRGRNRILQRGLLYLFCGINADILQPSPGCVQVGFRQGGSGGIPECL